MFRCVWSWLPGRHLIACLCVDSTNLFSNPRRCVCPPTTERRDHCVAVFRLSCGNPVFLLWGWRAYLAVSRFYRYRVEDLLRFSNRNGGWSAVPVLTTVYEVPRSRRSRCVWSVSVGASCGARRHHSFISPRRLRALFRVRTSCSICNPITVRVARYAKNCFHLTTPPSPEPACLV